MPAPTTGFLGRTRNTGSIHADVWHVTAADLAAFRNRRLPDINARWPVLENGVRIAMTFTHRDGRER